MFSGVHLLEWAVLLNFVFDSWLIITLFSFKVVQFYKNPMSDFVCVCEDREVILSESVYLQFWAHWVLRAVFLAGFCSNMSAVLYEISVRNTEPSAKMHKVPLIWMLSGQNTLHVRFLPCATWAGVPQLFA